MTIRALVSVDGYDFPEPSTYSGNTSTLVDSARNVEGRMVGSAIRADISKVEISWKYLTVEQWSNILKCFKGITNFVNTVTYFDQGEGDWVTKEMYVSDRKANIFRRDPNTGNVIGWENPSLSLIEV